MRTVIHALCWASALLLSTQSRAAEIQAIVIVDATAQMSAKLGQQRKIDWVKSSVGAAVSRMDPANSVALWAFGTNSAKRCEDSRELVSLQPVTATAADAAQRGLGPLQPTAARSPIMGTLQSALKSPTLSKDKPLVAVIISGTGDDCIGDICSVAATLHTDFPNAKLNVLGLGMSEQAGANFACSAKAMGGAFTAIKSGTELDKTLRQSLDVSPTAQPLKAASATPAATSGNAAGQPASAPAVLPPAPAPSDNDAKVPPPPPQPEPNVVLSASLTDGSPALESGVTWEIYKMNTTPTGQVRPADTPTWTGGGGPAKVKLPEGRYLAHIEYGLAAGSTEFTAVAQKLEKTVPLYAGTIAAEALQVAGGQTAVQGAFFTLYRRKADGSTEEISRSSKSPAIFPVNAGDYVVAASAGSSRLETTVRAEAGKVSLARIGLNVGTLEVKTLAQAGGPAVSASHRLRRSSPSGPAADAPMMRLEGMAPRIELPAGDYRIETLYGYARQDTAVTITAGQTSAQTIVLDAGEAKVTVAKPDKVCAVYEAGKDHGPSPLARGAGPEMTFTLKSGLYDLDCHAKNPAIPAKQAQVRVVAGATQAVRIDD